MDEKEGFRQAEIFIGDDVNYIEHGDESVTIMYRNYSRTVIEFKSTVAAMKFFNDNNFLPGQRVIASDIKSIKYL